VKILSFITIYEHPNIPEGTIHDPLISSQQILPQKYQQYLKTKKLGSEMEGSKNKKCTPETKGNLKLTDKWKFIIYVEDHNQ